MSEALNDATIHEKLGALPGWEHRDQALTKTFRCQTFREALSFIVRVGFEAEALDHHPEIRNVYGTVTLVLRTHDAGDRVTARDLALAAAIQRFSWVG